MRVARALRGLPLICEAFAAGRLSYAKVRAVTRVASADNERALLDFALAGTASPHVGASRIAPSPGSTRRGARCTGAGTKTGNWSCARRCHPRMAPA